MIIAAGNVTLTGNCVIEPDIALQDPRSYPPFIYPSSSGGAFITRLSQAVLQ